MRYSALVTLLYTVVFDRNALFIHPDTYASMYLGLVAYKAYVVGRMTKAVRWCVA